MINKEKNIKLSIIVSVYNVKEYLEDCLRSLSEQNIQNVEFIIVDDGSTDGSSEICDHWGLYDKRFTIIHQENKGTLLARKVGILKSKGERIIFIDGDDLLAKNALRSIIQLIKICNSDIIQFSSSPFNCINNRQYKEVKKYINTSCKNINRNIDISESIFIKKTINWTVWNKVYNSKILKKVCKYIDDIYCISYEDMYFLFLISFFSNTFSSYKTKPLYYYRYNAGISTKKQNLQNVSIHIQNAKILLNIDIFLQHEHASYEWYKCFNAIKEHMYSSLIYIISKLSKNDLKEAFNLFYNEYDIIYSLPWIETNFIERQNEIAISYIFTKKLHTYKIEKNLQLKKTIGIFYHRYYNGGVEQVISRHILLFTKLGYRIIFFTEEINEQQEYFLPKDIVRIHVPRSYKQNRADVFISAIKKYNISIFCHHATSSLYLLFDLILLREMGCHIILISHEVTDFLFALNIKYFVNKVLVYKMADTVLVLSKSEERFYQQCGINACYIPNPINNVTKQDIIPISKRNPVVIWIGRLENNAKNYRDALKILKTVVIKNNEAVGYIIGSGNFKDNFYVKFFIKFNRLKGKLIHIPYTKEVKNFYKKASVHLVTSSFESFGLVIAEGKLYGIPLVTYDLPVVELLKNNKGYVRVERHNIQDAAEEILKILRDKKYAERLSQEARESISHFIQFDQEKTWSEILKNPCRKYVNIDEKDANNMCLFWSNVIDMYNEGLLYRTSSIEFLKHTLLKIKYIVKNILSIFLPLGSQRRIIIVKMYYYTKNYLKNKIL